MFSCFVLELTLLLRVLKKFMKILMLLERIAISILKGKKELLLNMSPDIIRDPLYDIDSS